MKPSIFLSTLALSVSVAAAPVYAQSTTQPTEPASQAAGNPLGTLDDAQIALIIGGVLIAGALIGGGGSSSSTPVTGE